MRFLEKWDEQPHRNIEVKILGSFFFNQKKIDLLF